MSICVCVLGFKRGQTKQISDLEPRLFFLAFAPTSLFARPGARAHPPSYHLTCDIYFLVLLYPDRDMVHSACDVLRFLYNDPLKEPETLFNY